MSIIQVNHLSYIHADRTPLFEGVSFSLSEHEKVALIGANGSGKSTLLHLIAERAEPSAGEIAVSGQTYYVTQHFGQYNGLTIAGALGIEAKITALDHILAGELEDHYYSVLQDDWEIEEKALAALDKWGLSGFSLDQPLESLSGGEKTRVFLSGISIHQPDLILMDEPSNHLDKTSRGLLYELVRNHPAAMIVVSHDRTLLNLLPTTIELGRQGVSVYGGNYEFYKEQKEIRLRALQEQVEDREKSLRIAQKTARQAAERKEKQEARGKGKMKKEGVPRIMHKIIKDGAAASAKKLQEVHSDKIGAITEELNTLRQQTPDKRLLKIKLDDSSLHAGKILLTADSINFSYGEKNLWAEPLSWQIRSGERIAVEGDNGSGKTTLVKLILGTLKPTTGSLFRAEGLHYLYIDQEYSLIDDQTAVLGQIEKFNTRKLPEHLLKTELHRFLFPFDTWDKPCGQLSGGEKMRLIFCCLLISNSTPDLFILDEPTNNLDIQSLEIVTQALRNYNGTLLVISHDQYFIREIGVTRVIVLS